MTKKRVKIKEKGHHRNFAGQKSDGSQKKVFTAFGCQKAIEDQKKVISAIGEGFRAPRTKGKQSVPAKKRMKV